jgi:protein-disulfide isomerase
VAGLITLGGPWAAQAEAQELEVEGIGYVVGSASAPVEVIEFGDFACSACAEFWRDTWPRVRTELVESGRVRWRHVPFLLGFDRGDDAANAAECAAEQGGFWTMHDRLFGGQSEWIRGRSHDDVFLRYAEEIGLALEDFSECYEDERGEDRTDDANRAARQAGVRATPTFFIDGSPVLGAVSFDVFLELVRIVEEDLQAR